MLRHIDLADYPHAHEVRSGVLVYSAASMASLKDGAHRRALQGELIHAFTDGPGVVVIEGAFADGVVDAASAAFNDLIAAQQAAGGAAGDHFGRPGANDRIWNAAQKLALHAPEVFADYYANDSLAMVSQAWLGPVYQVTSQVNVVNPGGAAQVPHRDYHLGFVNEDQLHAYPAHMHHMSAVLTLQGAVAHCDMPIESGPTMLLPNSQRFAAGFIAFYRPAFIEFFAEHQVQMPLRKGDGITGPRRDGPGDIPVAAENEGRRPSTAGTAQRRGRHCRGLPLPHRSRQRQADRQPGSGEPGGCRARCSFFQSHPTAT